MKKYFYFIVLIILAGSSCSEKKNVPEPGIFFTLSKAEPGTDASSGIQIGLENTYFGKEFWEYFSNKFPVSTGLLWPEDSVATWGICKFQKTADANIDTAKMYFTRTLDIDLRKKLLQLLPHTANKNEWTIVAQKNNKVAENTIPNSLIHKDYSRFRNMLADTAYNILTLYCDKEIMKQVQMHKYVL